MRGIPADSDDVETGFDREVQELSLVIQALAADVLVSIVARPGDLSFEQLTCHAMSADVRQYRAEPVIEHPGLEFKAYPEANWPVIHLGDQSQAIVAAEKAALEKIHLATGAEHLVVEFYGAGKQRLIGDNDIYVGQVVSRPFLRLAGLLPRTFYEFNRFWREHEPYREA